MKCALLECRLECWVASILYGVDTTNNNTGRQWNSLVQGAVVVPVLVTFNEQLLLVNKVAAWHNALQTSSDTHNDNCHLQLLDIIKQLRGNYAGKRELRLYLVVN